MMLALKRIIGKFILRFSGITHIDLLALAHQQIGVLREAGTITDGEKYFIEHTLKKIIRSQDPVFYDGGANIGEYSLLLRQAYPLAKIFSFEPNPEPYATLRDTSLKAGLKPIMAGLSSSTHTAMIFLAPTETSKYGTLYKEVITDIHRHNRITSSQVQLISIDDFCTENKIEYVNFLKLDIEGHELEALKGAKHMLAKDLIGIVQFEFNAVNVISRIFLKDFYDLMPNYTFYRIKKGGLLPLGKYNAINEIFRVHNLIAVSKNIMSKLDERDIIK